MERWVVSYIYHSLLRTKITTEEMIKVMEGTIKDNESGNSILRAIICCISPYLVKNVKEGDR